jgi:large subunit ribosomal protein L30
MIAIIRLKSGINARKEVKDTLRMLRLNRKMHCVLYKETESIRGMLQAIKDYVTWGEINDDVLKILIKKRGRKIGDEKLNEKEVEDVFNSIKEKGKIHGIKLVFRLTPPSRGFRKSIKQIYPNGELGYRGEKINELLKRMI